MVQDAVLFPYPTTPVPDVRSVTTQVQFDGTAGLMLRFALAGALDRLRLPAAGAVERADRLWEHTCFEAFVGGEVGSRYLEFNFAPSRQWAAYAFHGYRERDDSWIPPVPRIEIDCREEVLELRARIPTEALRLLCPSRTLRLALATVIEAHDGTLSYWALAHPTGRPDFHHAAGFVLTLDVVSATAAQPVAGLP